jgi:hypothetical protein
VKPSRMSHLAGVAVATSRPRANQGIQVYEGDRTAFIVLKATSSREGAS